jgi:PRTRC genetic system protein C
MALQARAMPRVFKYNGTELPCPGSNLTTEAVRDIYSANFPELTSATIDGPTTKHGKLVYEFVRTAGAKGAEV